MSMSKNLYCDCFFTQSALYPQSLIVTLNKEERKMNEKVKLSERFHIKVDIHILRANTNVDKSKC